jgi:predicted transcriptional regulator
MQKLTRAEEEIMQKLWKLERAFLKEIIAAFPEPKPAQSTVSTLLKILENKGFVDHETFGKSFQYYPKVSKGDYSKAFFGTFLQNYFGGSFKKMLHFFVEENDLDLATLDELVRENNEKEEE